MWESQLHNNIRSDSKLKVFVFSRQPPTPQRAIQEQEILTGRLFDMVKIDIRVLSQWPSHSTMTNFEYFSKMSPLFCTTEVLHDIIGDHM